MAKVLKERDFGGGRVFQVVSGDLLQEPVEAIVNAANGRLQHGGGVAGAIARAAGENLARASADWVQRHGPLPSGAAALTTAGALPFKGVIHAVGPRLGEGDEEEKLTAALAAAFAIAEAQGWASLSFPAVSSGIFAVPAAVCIRAYMKAVADFFSGRETLLKTIRLCLFPGPLLEELEREWPHAWPDNAK